ADAALAMVRVRRLSSGSLLHAARRRRVGHAPAELASRLDRLDRADVRSDLAVLQPLRVDLLRGGDELLPLRGGQTEVPGIARSVAEPGLVRLREGGVLVDADRERREVL